MSVPSAASTLDAMTKRCRYVTLKLWLIKAHTPEALRAHFFASTTTPDTEMLCFAIKIAYASDAWEREYLALDPALKASFLPWYEQTIEGRGRHIRTYLGMKTDALDFLSIIMATLGLLHHWVLLPLEERHTVHSLAAGEVISQERLSAAPSSLSQLVRSLIPVEARHLPNWTLDFAITMQEASNSHASHLPRWSQAASMRPQPSTNARRKERLGASQRCIITGGIGAEGAHLIPHSYNDLWVPILTALDAALEGIPDCLSGHFEHLKMGMDMLKTERGNGLQANPMSNANDVVPLSRHCHGFFDSHRLLLNPFGMTWLWTSECTLPTDLLLDLEPLRPVDGTSQPQAKPFGELYTLRDVETKNMLLPPMLIAACKIVLYAWGTESLRSAFASGAGQALATREGLRRSTAASSSHQSSIHRQRHTNISDAALPGIFEAAATASGDGADDSAVFAVDNALEDGGDSSSFVTADANTSGDSDPSVRSLFDSSTITRSLISSLASSVPSSSSAGRVTGPQRIALPVAASLTREDLARSDFDRWWTAQRGGSVGSSEKRKACLRLEKLSFAEVSVEEEEQAGHSGKEGSYKRSKALHQNMLISPEEYARLDSNLDQHGKDLHIVVGEQEYEDLLADRYAASFYLFMPVLLATVASAL